MKKIIVVAGLTVFSQAASAHTGLLPTGGFSHGFMHPFLGLDHFLAMLGLGLWASSQSRRLAKQAIGVFLLFMAAGALLGLAGFGFAYVETAVLISLLLVGMALSFGITSIVPALRRGNSVRNAPALRRRDAGVIRQAHDRLSDTAFPRWSVGTVIVLTSIAVFASMHGLAHGGEMPVAVSAYAYIAGIVSATALLHFSGLALGLLAQRVNAAGFLLRVYGTLTGVIGAWLLFSA
ncbi:MAG: HupE/UreJ family protein [Methylobacter sp.]|jgi:urease accessory protein|nr:HupE/UreJ family protein [Methylobacter sp.]